MKNIEKRLVTATVLFATLLLAGGFAYDPIVLISTLANSTVAFGNGAGSYQSFNLSNVTEIHEIGFYCGAEGTANGTAHFEIHYENGTLITSSDSFSYFDTGSSELQNATFSSPVNISANETYAAFYALPVVDSGGDCAFMVYDDVYPGGNRYHPDVGQQLSYDYVFDIWGYQYPNPEAPPTTTTTVPVTTTTIPSGPACDYLLSTTDGPAANSQDWMFAGATQSFATDFNMNVSFLHAIFFEPTYTNITMATLSLYRSSDAALLGTSDYFSLFGDGGTWIPQEKNVTFSSPVYLAANSTYGSYYVRFLPNDGIVAYIRSTSPGAYSRGDAFRGDSPTTEDYYISFCGENLSDSQPPKFTHLAQNASTIYSGESVALYSNWTDDYGLSTSFVSTNETGSWVNYTNSLNVLSGTAQASNFVWNNASLVSNTTVGWQIWANDTSGNWNATDILAFAAVELPIPPTTTTTIPSGYAPTYQTGDFAAITFDVLGNIGIGILAVAPLIALGALYLYVSGKPPVRRKK